MKVNRLVIADPSDIVLNGLSVMLREISDYEVVMKSSDMRTLQARIPVLRPDILIINPLMIDASKRRMVRSLYENLPDMKIIALVTSFCESQLLRQFHGVLEINDDLQRIRSTLHQVAQRSDYEGDAAALSDREKEVLIGLAKGLKNNEIADGLGISIHTVVSHRKNIVRKTGIKSVSALTVYAMLNNWIDEKDII